MREGAYTQHVVCPQSGSEGVYDMDVGAVFVHSDRSIPSLDAVLNGDSREQYEKMATLVTQQIEREASSLTDSHVTPSLPHNSHPSLDPPHRSFQDVHPYDRVTTFGTQLTNCEEFLTLCNIHEWVEP